MPLLFLLLGVALDLGWYYFNVSRLQNAADAAALAGAQELAAHNSNFKGYNIVLVDKQFSVYPEPDEDISTAEGDEVAADYVRRNLSSDDKATPLTNEAGTYAYTVTDNWSPNSSKVTMTPHLGQNDDAFYYVVHLTEDIRHFLMPGRYAPIPAPVVAVAMLTKNPKDDEPYTPPDPPDNPIPRDPGKGAEQQLPDGTDILTEMYKLEDVSVTRNWEWQDYYPKHKDQYKTLTGKDVYIGKWNEYQDKGGIHYDASKNKYYRTETAQVYAGSPSQGSSTGKVANHGEDEIDSLNLDFKADVLFTKKWSQAEWTDFDIKYSDSSAVTYQNGAKIDSAHLRIHSTFNFETPYDVRSNRTATQIEENPEDALYVRVESEPIEALSFKSDHRSYSSVRQIFLNINQSNMGANDRPLVLYYDGPEQINPKDLDENGKHKRDSQPVVLTLNADARVILFAPNSPVVIRGNNHKMQGFVIAREFVQLTEASDYYQEDGKYYNSSAKTKEYFYVASEGTFIDEHGNVQTKSLGAGATRNRIEEDDREKPVGNTRIAAGYESYEKVYGMKNFNIAGSSFFDSFKIPSLKRTIYTYLDNYTDDEKDVSVDMFFTKIRASWID